MNRVTKDKLMMWTTGNWMHYVKIVSVTVYRRIAVNIHQSHVILQMHVNNKTGTCEHENNPCVTS